MTHTVTLNAEVPQECSGKRLDVVAAQLFPEYSRARLQGWIKAGELLVNDRQSKVNTKLIGGERISIAANEEPQGDWLAEPMNLNIVFEDDHLLVVNKPAGLVVHPAAGNYDGTLLNGLLHHNPSCRAIPRAGIVHRLDKDTTGLMVVAKTLSAQTSLVSQLQARTVSRTYVALVYGHPPPQGVVEGNIGRDPNNRKKMAVVASGKEATTHYKTLAYWGPLAWLELKLETGRTHQIRVHMTNLGHPLVGDPVYGRKTLNKKSFTEAQFDLLSGLKRQALHAKELSLVHPNSKELCHWQAPLPDDLAQIAEILAND